jgi:hypothetical protein
MRRVAANQDRAQELRSAFVYDQEILIRFFRGNGKLAREEVRQYGVIPGPSSTVKTLAHFRGKYETGGKYVDYEKPGFRCKDVDLDGELMDDFADDLANDRGSRDGIAADLFPLASKARASYRFSLQGTEEYRGRQVFRIQFKPAEKGWDDAPWAGTILVDAREYQPVMITTHLAESLPLFVRTILGTNLKGLGFKIDYERFDEGLWFPVKYGGEFELRAVFFYKRRMAIVLRNQGFQRARVDARVTFQEPRAGVPE